MKRLASTATFLFAVALLAPPLLRAQADDIPSAAPAQPSGKTDTQQGHTLLNEMVTALGGQAWLNRTSIHIEGRTAAFFQGQPNLSETQFREDIRLPASGQPRADRIGFLTDRGVIIPGKKVDVIQVYSDGKGIETTYKGQTPLPKEQVAEYYLLQKHSIESIVHTWLKAPGVMVVYEGAAMVERHIADTVSVLAADNDTVTLELDASTHLPLRLSFQTRNDQFHDLDQDSETFDDYHTIQRIQTPLTITHYHNGEIANQRFLTTVVYNLPHDPAYFDPVSLQPKKK